MEQVRCTGCGELIHPMRLEILPNTKTCVKCSQVTKKAGRLTSSANGEDVETKLEFLDQETYRKIVMIEKGYNVHSNSDEEE